MSNSYEEIIGAALTLSPGARAMLAEHLLESLDAPNQNEIDALWATEVESRSKDVIEGRVNTIPSYEVFRELRARDK